MQEIDDDFGETMKLIVNIEHLPPMEPKKEGSACDVNKSIFGPKGEHLAKQEKPVVLIENLSDDDDELVIVGDNMNGFSSQCLNPKIKRPKPEVEFQVPDPIHITRLPTLQREQPLFHKD